MLGDAWSASVEHPKTLNPHIVFTRKTKLFGGVSAMQWQLRSVRRNVRLGAGAARGQEGARKGICLRVSQLPRRARVDAERATQTRSSGQPAVPVPGAAVLHEGMKASNEPPRLTDLSMRAKERRDKSHCVTPKTRSNQTLHVCARGAVVVPRRLGQRGESVAFCGFARPL